jgi:hypothetical protein
MAIQHYFCIIHFAVALIPAYIQHSIQRSTVVTLHISYNDRRLLYLWRHLFYLQ